MIQLFNSICYFACLFHSFLSPGKCHNGQHYKGLYSRDVDKYEIVIPQRVDEHGKFVSNLIPHHYNKRSTKESNFIFYKLPIAGEEYIVQLTPNLKLISPGAVVEIHGKNTKRKNESNSESGSAFENLQIKKMKMADCHYSGFVKGHVPSKVALSTCFGLAGFIQTQNGTYTIEPVAEYDASAEDEHPHIIYEIGEQMHNWTVCNTVDFQGNRSAREIKETANNGNASVISSPLYIETLLVMDQTFLNHHEDFDAENYILTVFNMAFSLFSDASLGLPIKLSLVRVIRLETEYNEMNVNINQDAMKTLEYFQDWQHRINPGDDSHPNHHDVAILVTRINVFSNLTYRFLGISTLGSACDKKLSSVLCKDNGLRLGFVMAHEIAHLLGAEHDGFNNSCVGVDGDGFRTVMHPQVLLTTETWSKCTKGYIKIFMDSGYGNCLLDEPSDHHFNVQESLPGSIYNADFQCRQLLNTVTRECDEGSTCDSLNCKIPGSICVMTKTPPAAGTRCGENMWCRQNKCLMIGERPDAVDGNWGEWSAWSECSRTCGSGVSRSSRHCNRPVPSRGGKYCLGESTRHRICSSKPCDMGQPSFRDIQCGEFDDWTYPEDGRKHTWKEYFYHDENPCILFCINENLEVVALRPRVIDGTPCYRGIRDVCVDGVCRGIPCDLNIESNAIEDVCGVCHGDGTTCDFSQGKQSMEKFPKAMTKLITIPVGTRNVKVEEVLPSAARILVRDKETKEFYVRGNKLGMFPVPGSQAWLGLIKSKQEALTIPGPVTKALSVWIERAENVTVKWSMALPTTQQRKPEFTWDFVRWGPCSAICGPGTQKSEPSCIEEKAGLVESSYCADLEVPPTKVRLCEVSKCEPRWMVADWMECENGSSSNRVKRRIVHCVKMVGDGGGTSDIIPDEECPPPKPEEEEPCDTRRKRDSSEHVIRKKSIFRNSVQGDLAMFSSNRIKYGFHKKYDEYLKNFNAIATPQRKSEMIPFHLLGTPHFKDYYRVLQTSEYTVPELNNKLDLDKMLQDAKKDIKKNPNSLLSQIYKKTFSGNEVNFNSGADSSPNVQEESLSHGRYNSLSRRRKKWGNLMIRGGGQFCRPVSSVRRSYKSIPQDSPYDAAPLSKLSDSYGPRSEDLPKRVRTTQTKGHSSRRHMIFFPVRYQTEHRRRMKNKKLNFHPVQPFANGFGKNRFRHLVHGKRSVAANDSRDDGNCTEKKLQSDQLNREKIWQRIKFIGGRKGPDAKLKKSKAKDTANGKSGHVGQGNANDPDLDEIECESASEKPMENYTIRFGQVLVDKDEDENLEIIFEEGEKDGSSGVESNMHPLSDRDRIWNIRGEEAIQFLQNITMLDWNNSTMLEDGDGCTKSNATDSDGTTEPEPDTDVDE